MLINICEERNMLGREAARKGAELIRKTIEEKGECLLSFVTGMSQVPTLENLAKAEGIDWSKCEVFLLDEFIDIPKGHRSSSVEFIRNHFLSKIGPVKEFHIIPSSSKDIKKTLKTLNEELDDKELDVTFICIGENGHLAFNDPPADFDAKDPYIVVDLDTRNKRQMVNEGWFDTIAEVPDTAITMSIHEILTSNHIIVSCPDQRKAKAVAMALFDQISPLSPAAAIRRAHDTHLFLDRQSSCMILSDRRSN